MKTRSYEVVFVTPAFPGGARPREAGMFDGVRPSSVIFGLRFWFRALAGSLTGSREGLKKVRAAEGYLFGTARDGGFAARMVVAVTQSGAEEGKLFPKIEEYEGKDYTLRYLAYGMYPTNFKEPWVRKGFGEGARFSFELSLRKNPEARKGTPLGDPNEKSEKNKAPLPQQETMFELVSRLAVLWVNLGGVGARWRHGLASMRLTKVDGEPVTEVAANAYLSWVTKQLNEARDLMEKYLQEAFPGEAVPREQELPQFPVAHPRFFQVAFKENAGNSCRMALREIHTIWRRSRVENPADSRSSSKNAGIYATFLKGQMVAGREVQFAGLGLPIPFGFPKGGPGVKPRASGQLTPRPEGSKEEKREKAKEGRRASPVWFRVVETAPKRFGILCLVWSSVYLPETTKVVLHDTDGKVKDVVVKFVPTEATAWAQANLVKKGFRLG